MAATRRCGDDLEDWRRADLHLHTLHSGWRRLHLIDACDSYMTPEAAYATALARGMDFVCFTDHDSIDGAMDFLSRHPEEEPRVIIGEEREVRLPVSRQWLHLAVYGLDERDHRILARLHDDAFETIAYLRERGLLFALNHPFQSFRSIASARRDLARLLPLVPAVEVANSSSPPSHRPAIEAMLDGFTRGGGVAHARLGGSDAHTPRRVAATWTAAPGRTKQDYLDSIRRGACVPGGEAMGLPALVRDAYRVIAQYYRAVYAPSFSPVESRDLRNILGSIGLLPAVVLGLPVTLTLLHVLRQEWIARVGAWETMGAAQAAQVPAGVAAFHARPSAAHARRAALQPAADQAFEEIPPEPDVESEPAANL
jgi:predicted metal-dependent phosphoesterase TrpH